MRYYIFESGSKGNCTLIQSNGRYLVVDNGLSVRRFKAYLSSVNVSLAMNLPSLNTTVMLPIFTGAFVSLVTPTSIITFSAVLFTIVIVVMVGILLTVKFCRRHRCRTASDVDDAVFSFPFAPDAVEFRRIGHDGLRTWGGDRRMYRQ